MLYLVSRFIFPFLFSDFNREATVKTEEITGLKQLFTLSTSKKSHRNNNDQGIIQKKSASGSRMLPFVIFDKKFPSCQK